MQFSPPLRGRLLAVARTYADLHDREHLTDEDIALALSMPPFAMVAERSAVTQR